MYNFVCSAQHNQYLLHLFEKTVEEICVHEDVMFDVFSLGHGSRERARAAH